MLTNWRRLAIVAALLTNLAQASEYQSWALRGAAERIEKYRTGQVELQFLLPDGDASDKPLSVDLELQKHAFIFGISMGQSWALHALPGFSAYRQHMQEVFNTVSLGFFWSKLEPRRGDIRHIDYLNDDIRWAQAHGLSIKGTHLLWHQSLPEWLDPLASPESLEIQITDHIRYLLETYPQVSTWNAYNEVLGAMKKQAPDNAITRWVSWKGGADVAQAFVLNEARRIRPNLRYINNHFNYVDDQFVELNKRLNHLGHPPDVIGLQTHMHTMDKVPSESELWGGLERYAQLGQPIQLTEVSVPSSRLWTNARELRSHLANLRQGGKRDWMKNSRASIPELEAHQAKFIHDFYTLAFSHPAVEGITYWSGSDLFEWRGAAAGLISTEGKPKPAYHELKALIKSRWHTRLTAVLPVNGRMSFRGYYGEYQGRVTTASGSASFTFCHSPHREKAHVIVIGQETQPQRC